MTMDAAGAAAVMPKWVSAVEGQYELLPPNEATIVYKPSAVGCHIFAKVPLESLMTVPITWEVPDWSMAVRVTGTPVTLVGLGFCM